ncbi:MAG: hypothetical protein ABJE66_00220 [Deltaproteobacteria bacterium]
MISWRTAAIALAIVCCVQRWQSCMRTDHVARPTSVEHERTGQSLRAALVHSFDTPNPASSSDAPTLPNRTFFGFRPPAWAAHLLPQPGETMRAYRDRIVPIAQVVIAPQRARVARMRDQLPASQRTALDAATSEAAAAIEVRITSAIVNGELQPSALRPMTGVTLARDVLDIVDRGNTRFVGGLTPGQRAGSTFDFADYLLFSTRWEDALGAR